MIDFVVLHDAEPVRCATHADEVYCQLAEQPDRWIVRHDSIKNTTSSLCVQSCHCRMIMNV